ncbi:MAG: antibiotic biosynthesis monooxygenase [Thermoanaerobaculia bacterium]
MYLRFVKLKVKTAQVDELERVYSDVVIPALRGTSGCLWAGLLAPRDEVGLWMSMTLWRSQNKAEAHETDGGFQHLMNEISPYLTDPVRWGIDLWSQPPAEPDEEPEESSIEGHSVEASSSSSDSAIRRMSDLHVRIVSITVRTGMLEEFRNWYRSDVIPVVSSMTGCRYVFFVEDIHQKDRGLSVTIWNTEDAAFRYDSSGIFDAVMEKAIDTSAEPSFGEPFRISDSDTFTQVVGVLEVTKYRLLVGERL